MLCEMIAYEIRTDRPTQQKIKHQTNLNPMVDNKQQIYEYDKCDLCIEAACSGHSYNTLEQ